MNIRQNAQVEEVLAGGVANAAAVTRIDGHVLRPANAHSESIHRFLAAVHATGFNGVPKSVGLDTDGRERLEFIEGDVALPPFPAWVQTDAAMASITELIRELHDVSRAVALGSTTWSDELADPEGGPVICHNDVCPENAVFRDGIAIALLDFDYASPGRPAWDLARFATMCIPIDDGIDAARLGFLPGDGATRARLICDVYGLNTSERAEFLSIVDLMVAQSGRWVLSKVQAGDANFTKMWNDNGGIERHDRRRRWWMANRDRFAIALD